MKMKYDIKKLSIMAFCIYLAAVALLCFIRPSSLPEVDIKTFLGIPIDKMLHFLMFLPYPILSGIVFISKGQKTPAVIVTLLLIALTGNGVAYGTEIIQSYTDYRSYEIADFHADMTGIAAGSIITASCLIRARLKK